MKRMSNAGRNCLVRHCRMPVCGRAATLSAIFCLLVLVAAGTAPATAQCVKFDALASGTVWGGSAGNSAGDVVHVENGIRVSVEKFANPGGVGSFGDASVDNTWSTSSPNSVNTNNINLGFDFTALLIPPTQVAVKFRDLGGFENLSINGSPPIVGELSSGGGGGLAWTVNQLGVPGGREGKLIVSGTVQSLVLGGQEFWVDTLCVTAAGQRSGLDHFLIYEVKNAEYKAAVGLRGQFDRGNFVKTVVGNLTHFANPVSKNSEPIVHKEAHLTWYKIIPDEPQQDRVVVVSNQFGRQKLEVGAAVLFAVPAEKHELGSSFPEHLDHFKCYKADGNPVNREVKLVDQFEGVGSVARRPVLLCLPVAKRHNDRIFDIKNPDGHLVVYDLVSSRFERRIGTTDQFNKRKLQVDRRVLLAVPSKKLFTSGR